jgi:hypothetical protein
MYIHHSPKVTGRYDFSTLRVLLAQCREVPPSLDKDPYDPSVHTRPTRRHELGKVPRP